MTEGEVKENTSIANVASVFYEKLIETKFARLLCYRVFQPTIQT